MCVDLWWLILLVIAASPVIFFVLAIIHWIAVEVKYELTERYYDWRD